MGEHFFQGVRLATVPGKGQTFPVRLPARCDDHRRRWRIPKLVIQTGRGQSAQAHNGDITGRATALARAVVGRQWRFSWFDDNASRAFVSAHCPRALAAYDCLVPVAFKADVFRYCALYHWGGVYYDAEDVLLQPLSTLIRPCDELVLARDKCPTDKVTDPAFGYGWKTHALSILRAMPLDDRLKHFGISRGSTAEWEGLLAQKVTSIPKCPHTAVQISFMAGAPRHPFFKCCLQLVIRNVRRNHYGPTDLFPTGPGLAGECLEKLSAAPGGLNYSMELVQGDGGLYHIDGRAAVRVHAWQGARRPYSKKGWRKLCRNATAGSAVTLRKCKATYGQMWQRRSLYNCSG